MKSWMWSNGKDSRRQVAPPPQGHEVLHPLFWSWLQLLPPVSFSPLGQPYDIMRFRRMLCPDPSCEVCNRATAEINSLLYPESLEDATPSESPLASTDSVTESSFPLSSAFSALRPGDPIPASPTEPSSRSPPILSTNTVTPLPNSPSALPLGHSLPPEPFHPLESKFLAEHSQSQRPGSPSRGILKMDRVLQPEAPLTLNTIFLDPSLSEYIDPLPDLSENDPHQFICSPSRSSSAAYVSITRLVSLTQSEQCKPEYHRDSSTETLQSGVDKHDAAIALPCWSSKDKPTEPYLHWQPSDTEDWRILG